VFGAAHVGLLNPTPSPVGFGTSGDVSVNVSGPFVRVSVPLAGLGAAKLITVSQAAAEQRRNAKRSRGLNAPDSEAAVLCMN